MVPNTQYFGSSGYEHVQTNPQAHGASGEGLSCVVESSATVLEDRGDLSDHAAPSPVHHPACPVAEGWGGQAMTTTHRIAQPMCGTITMAMTANPLGVVWGGATYIRSAALHGDHRGLPQKIPHPIGHTCQYLCSAGHEPGLGTA